MGQNQNIKSDDIKLDEHNNEKNWNENCKVGQFFFNKNMY